ncbi:MAG: DUF1127 domain-containing protein [Kiloniellales bacterium]
MTGVLKSDLLLSTGDTPKTARSFAVEAVNARGVTRTEEAKKGLLSKLVSSLRAARARRATLTQLSRLDDAALRDIGLEPGTLVETVEATMEKRNASYQRDNHGALSNAGHAVRRGFSALDNLQRLNDRLLSDVGISRADLESNIVDQRVAVANHNRAFFRAA